MAVRVCLSGGPDHCGVTGPGAATSAHCHDRPSVWVAGVTDLFCVAIFTLTLLLSLLLAMRVLADSHDHVIPAGICVWK